MRSALVLACAASTAAASGTCADLAHADGSRFHLGAGTRYGCRYFRTAERCALYGGKAYAGEDGLSANEACCSCGGGGPALPTGPSKDTRVEPCFGGFLSFLNALSPACQPYTLRSFDSLEVDRHVEIATRANTPAQIPDSLLGLHFMDGNPVPEEVLTFAGCRWVEEENACYQQFYGHKTWSWDDSAAGHALYALGRKVQQQGKFVFNADKTYCRITPTYPLLGGRIGAPEWLLEYDMYVDTTDALGGRWVRNTTGFGMAQPDYQLRRIVFPNGTRTANWNAHYVASIGEAGFLNSLTQRQFVAIEDGGETRLW